MKVRHFFFGRDLWGSRFGVLAAMSFASMMWFVVDWCMGTTFRSMSMPVLWVANILTSLIFCLPFILTRKVWLQCVVIGLLDLVLIANLMYSRTYFTGIPPESYLLIGNLGDFTASVWDSLKWRDTGFPIILALGLYAAHRLPDRKVSRLALRWGAWTSVFTIAAIILLSVKGGFMKQYDRLIESCYTSTCGVPAYTIAGHIVYHTLYSRAAGDPDLQVEIKSWLDEHNELIPLPELPDSVRPAKNLVIILLESFESWPLQKTIAGKELTPVLNSLIADSTTLFAPRMLTQVDAGHSIDAQLLLTTGLLPTIGNVFSTRFPDTHYPSLNQALTEKYGSKSAILTVDQLVTWNFGVIGEAFGYDNILDRSTWIVDEKVGNPAKLSDGSFLRQSRRKLEEELWPEGEPRMITLVTYSGHNPFLLPDRLKDPEFDISGNGFDPTLENYITMAHYTDAQLGPFIEYLKSRSDWPETIVLITGDHEGLASRRESIRAHSAQEADLVETEQVTPFIVLNSPVPGTYGKVMGQVDMFPTLLQLLGLNDYYWHGMGQSILDETKIPAAISSMTRTIAGDTSGLDSRRKSHWLDARRISDMIIRSDFLNSVAK